MAARVLTGSTVVLIDGPLDPAHPALIERIDPAPSVSTFGPAGEHASAIAEAMLAHAPGLGIVNLVVFGARLVNTVAEITQALERAVSLDADLIHCSFGLARKDPAMARAVARLVADGRLVVAAAAARGGPVYPAALPGVVSVQGDARCDPAIWSLLDLPTARFGACPRLDGRPEVGGASIAAAHLTGHLARMLSFGTPEPLETLADGAAHVGRERRSLSSPENQPETSFRP